MKLAEQKNGRGRKGEKGGLSAIQMPRKTAMYKYGLRTGLYDRVL